MSTPTSSIRSTAREVSAPYRNVHSSRVPGDTLVTNFFPAELSADTVTVWAGRWTSGEDIDALEAAREGLATWRDPDDTSRVYAWEISHPEAAPPSGFKPVTVSHAESPRLFQRLIIDAVHARLTDLGFMEKSGGGFVNYDSKNLLGEIPSLSGVVGDAIGIYPKIVVEGFFTKTAATTLVSGIIVDVLYTTRMDVTAAEWVAAGIGDALSGVYVKLVRGSAEAARFPQFEAAAVGRIAGIRADRCVLDDMRDPALAEIALASVAPEPTRANLTTYLLARHQQAYHAGEKDLIRKLRELVRPRTRHRYAEALVLQRLQTAVTAYPGLLLVPGVFCPLLRDGTHRTRYVSSASSQYT